MIQSTEQLVSAKGGDGASAMEDAQIAEDRIDSHLLLEIWLQERGRNIENDLLLRRVRRLLARALVEHRLSRRDEVEARRILSLIGVVENTDL